MNELILHNEESKAVDNVSGHDKQLSYLTTEIDALVVASQADVDAGTKLIREAKAIFKSAEADRRDIVDPINESVRKINDKYKPIKSLMEYVERVGKDKVRVYLDRVERERRESERKAREKAEKERLRKEELARKANERGDHKKAEEHLRKVSEVEAPVVEAEAVTSAGSHTVTKWKHDVVDFEELVLAVAKGIEAKRQGEDTVIVPTDALLPNDSYLRKMASGVKDLVRWPGVRFYSETDITVRGKK